MTGYVLFVHDNPGSGGISHVSAQLAAGLQALGWDVDHWNVRRARGDASKFAARLAQRRGVALATQNFSAAYASGLVCLLARRPWVMWVHGPVMDVLRLANTSGAKRRWLHWFYRRVRHVVCCSEHSRASLLAFRGDAGSRRQMAVIRNTAGPSFFAPPAAPRPQRRRLGFVGRLSPEKRPLLALEVLRALPSPYTLEMVGDGPLMAQLRTAGAQEIAAGRLTLAGAQAVDAQTYRRWDITLLCSAYEGYPLVPLESMAAGVPVVSAPIPAVVEMLGTQAATMLARDADPRSLAQAVQDISEREPAQLRRDIAAVNQEHDPRRFVQRWDELLRAILDT